MIKKDDLIDIFERMARERWAYQWGAAREGLVDCSGAFVYAYRILGGPSITHGSNSILRQSLGELLPMSAAKPGYAAVKIREWTNSESGNRWYDQPPGDCYHIGLVGRDGRILNAQGTKTGFVTSDAGTWTGCAPLLAVDYGEEMEDESVLYQAKVTTEKDPLRVRIWPGNGNVIGNVPRGATVDVLEDNGNGWPKIQYGSLVGYSSAEYLSKISDGSIIPGPVFGEDSGASGLPSTMTTLINDQGQTIFIAGNWRVAND